MTTITMLGAGMMGTALCVPLLDRGHEVRLVGTHLDRGIIETLQQTGVHPKLQLPLPPGSAISYWQVEQLAEALVGAEVVALGVSSAGVRWAGRTLAAQLDGARPLLMIAKGLEWDGQRFWTLPEVLQRELAGSAAASSTPVAVAGPCIAGELARRVETCVVFTGRDAAACQRLAGLAATAYYHVRTSPELVGTEVCAALKNAFAMGVGFGAGRHLRAGGEPGASVAWHNYEAALFAQAVAEMARLVELAGGARESAFGLPGAGDLFVTCQGGRTGRFGRWLGLGLTLPEAIARMDGATLECIDVLRVIAAALPALETTGRLASTELPLVRELCAVALAGAPVAVPFDRLHR